MSLIDQPPLFLLSLQYRATANDTYLLSASYAFVHYLYEEGGGGRVAFSPDNYFLAASVLLANATDGGTYHERARAGLRAWACADGPSVKYTPRGRVRRRRGRGGGFEKRRLAALVFFFFSIHPNTPSFSQPPIGRQLR